MGYNKHKDHHPNHEENYQQTGETKSMTAIKLDDAIVKAYQKQGVKDIEGYVNAYLRKELDAEEEPLDAITLERLEHGVGLPGNDEGAMSLEDFRDLRAKERAEARKKREEEKVALSEAQTTA
jgi:hypothetical protein